MPEESTEGATNNPVDDANELTFIDFPWLEGGGDDNSFLMGTSASATDTGQQEQQHQGKDGS